MIASFASVTSLIDFVSAHCQLWTLRRFMDFVVPSLSFNVPVVGVFACGFASSTDDSDLIPGVFHVYFEYYIGVRSNFTVCGQ